MLNHHSPINKCPVQLKLSNNHSIWLCNFGISTLHLCEIPTWKIRLKLIGKEDVQLLLIFKKLK